MVFDKICQIVLEAVHDQSDSYGPGPVRAAVRSLLAATDPVAYANSAEAQFLLAVNLSLKQFYLDDPTAAADAIPEIWQNIINFLEQDRVDTSDLELDDTWDGGTTITVIAESIDEVINPIV